MASLFLSMKIFKQSFVQKNLWNGILKFVLCFSWKIATKASVKSDFMHSHTAEGKSNILVNSSVNQRFSYIFPSLKLSSLSDITFGDDFEWIFSICKGTFRISPFSNLWIRGFVLKCSFLQKKIIFHFSTSQISSYENSHLFKKLIRFTLLCFAKFPRCCVQRYKLCHFMRYRVEKISIQNYLLQRSRNDRPHMR